MNLLKETQRDIEKNGYDTKDIVFIGSEESGHSCNWEQFQVLANREYRNGHGGTEVATDLIIVFSDGTLMSRDEYDGSEWWNFRKPFKMPEKKKEITNLFQYRVGRADYFGDEDEE